MVPWRLGFSAQVLTAEAWPWQLKSGNYWSRAVLGHGNSSAARALRWGPVCSAEELQSHARDETRSGDCRRPSFSAFGAVACVPFPRVSPTALGPLPSTQIRSWHGDVTVHQFHAKIQSRPRFAQSISAARRDHRTKGPLQDSRAQEPGPKGRLARLASKGHPGPPLHTALVRLWLASAQFAG